MDRRTFLALGVASLGVLGCSPQPVDPQPTPPPQPDPDAGIRAAVAQSEAGLIATYASAMAQRPELAEALAPFLAHHEAHLERVQPGGAAGWSTPTASGPPTDGSALDRGPGPADLLGHLARAEDAAHAQRVSACDGATDPDLARVLCLIAASEAQHGSALGALADGSSAGPSTDPSESP